MRKHDLMLHFVFASGKHYAFQANLCVGVSGIAYQRGDQNSA